MSKSTKPKQRNLTANAKHQIRFPNAPPPPRGRKVPLSAALFAEPTPPQLPTAVTVQLAMLPVTASEVDRVVLASNYVMHATALGAGATFLERALGIPQGSFIGAIIDGKLVGRYCAALGDQARLFSRTAVKVNTALAISGRTSQSEKSGRDVASEYSRRAIGIREDIAELGKSIPALGTALLVQDRQAARALKQARRERAETKKQKFSGSQGLIDRITASHAPAPAEQTEPSIPATHPGPITSGYTSKLNDWLRASTPTDALLQANDQFMQDIGFGQPGLPTLSVTGLPEQHQTGDDVLDLDELPADETDELPGPVQPSAAGSAPAAQDAPAQRSQPTAPKPAPTLTLNLGPPATAKPAPQAKPPAKPKVTLSALQHSSNEYHRKIAGLAPGVDDEARSALVQALGDVERALKVAERERASAPAQGGMTSPGCERSEYQDPIQARRKRREQNQGGGTTQKPYRYA